MTRWRDLLRPVLAAALAAAGLSLVGPGSSPAAATSGGTNGIIVYAMGLAAPTAQRWTVRSTCQDGTGQQELAKNAYNPSVSADGTKIAYQGMNNAANYGIWTMNVDGSNKTRLTTATSDGNPVWSPDGTKLAVTRNKVYPGLGGQVQIMVADATTGATLVEFYNDHSWRDMDVFNPVWSPDGQWLYYAADNNLSDGNSLYRVNPMGGTPQLVLDGSANSYFYNYLDIDPTSTKLLVGRQTVTDDPETGVQQTIQYNMTGGNEQILWTDEAFGATQGRGAASYSPDGTKLVYAAFDNGLRSMAISDADGTDEVWMDAYGTIPRWSTHVIDCSAVNPPSIADLRVYEVMLAAGGNPAAQYLELIAPDDSDAPSGEGPYKVVVYDAAGARLGAHTLSQSSLPPTRSAQNPILIGTAAADAALGSTRLETLSVPLPAAGAACVTRGAAETRRNCVTWGCLSATIASPNTQAIPYPTSSLSSQRNDPTSNVWQLATPTPRKYNVTGTSGQSCVPVDLPVFKATGAPKITGKAKPGKKLTAAGASWTPRPDVLTYQWLRGGKAIKGATAATYKVKKSDAGKKLSVVVTATKAGLSPVSATSPTVKVKKPKKPKKKG